MSEHLPQSPDIKVGYVQHRFLVAFGCALVILLERALGHWVLFFDASPLLSYLYVGFLALYFPAILPASIVCLLGLFADFLALDPFGVRTFTLTGFYLLIRWRADQIIDEDFITIWSQMALYVMAIALVRLACYVGLYVSFPDLLSLAYQTGMTILIFPILFVIGKSLAAILQR